jgi:hypothetical protein
MPAGGRPYRPKRMSRSGGDSRSDGGARRRVATPNMGRIVRTIRGSAGSVISRTYQQPGGAYRTFKKGR